MKDSRGERTQLTVRLPQQTHTDFKVLCAKRQIELSDVAESLIEGWIRQPFEKSQAPNIGVDSGNPYQKKLQAILDSGNADAISAVEKNIDVFFEYVTLRKKHPVRVK